MDLQLSDEQKELQEATRAFARRELEPDRPSRGAAGSFPTESWKRCASFGILGMPVPEEYGGTERDPVTIALVLEALGYGCRDNGFLFSLGAHMWSCVIPIVRFGSAEQRQRFLPALCNGTMIGVQAMTEPDSGSDAFSLRATARPSSDGYVLDGEKIFITNAPIADLFVVFAATDRDKGFAGITGFLVAGDAPGLKVGDPAEKMGLATSPMAEVRLDGCEVSHEQVLGKPGMGMTIFNTSMDWERGFILAPAVGTMQRQLERCIEYARTRKQFGQPIGKNQAISHTIAEMKVRVETSRQLLYRLAWLRATDQATPADSAMVKLHISECFIQSSLDALQIHGGYGYMTELGLEGDVRDAIGSRIYSGTSQIQRNIIAGYLGL